MRCRLRIFRVQSGREIRRVEFAEAKRESRWGSHAVMAAGYNDREKRFLIRNSWGSDWGRKGYFTMPFAYLADRNLSDDFWTIRASEEG
jgi:C1A family cysteine protease